MKALIKKHLFDGKFEIQGEIAKGQTGTVLYGYDIGLRQEVAIKIYHSHINGRLIRGKAFVEKSKPLLLLEHPNLIKIFKVEEEGDTPVVFMEFFDAPSLQQLIRDKGKLSVQDMLMLAREIAEVLVHTHFQGIIHGTLHPAHVLVGSQGQIKVMDLGLSWILMDILSDCDEEILRPLPYFPPELAKGELLNVSSDLYALGFMMYEMITGTVPYADLPKTSIMGKLAFDQADPAFDFPNTVPEAICDLIREMTRNKAQQRLQDATHVLTIINQQLSKLPLSKTSQFLPTEPRQTQAPTAEPQTETTKTEPEPSTNPEPALKREAPVRRPQASVDYNENNSMKMISKIGIIFGLIFIIGIAGVLGYWYRDLLEPHFPILQKLPEVPSRERTVPQTMPIENEIHPVLTQDSLKNQEAVPLPPNSHSQTLDTTNETVVDTTSSVKPTTPRLNNQATQPPFTQTPNAGNSQRKPPPAPIQKKPVPKISQAPIKLAPSSIVPTSKTAVSSSRIKAVTSPPVQNAPDRQPQATKIPEGRSLPPTPKEQISTPKLAPRKQEPFTGTPINSEIISPPITKPLRKAPLQKSTTQQPNRPKGQLATSFDSNPTQPTSKQSSIPVKQEPTKMLPPNSETVPESNIKTSKTELSQKSPIQNETKGVMDQPQASIPPTVLPEDISIEPTDEEIEEILQSLDAAKEDLSTIATP